MSDNETPLKYVAAKNRAAGSPAVFFGPFDSIEELRKFADDQNMTVMVIVLVDPKSDEAGWW